MAEKKKKRQPYLDKSTGRVVYPDKRPLTKTRIQAGIDSIRAKYPKSTSTWRGIPEVEKYVGRQMTEAVNKGNLRGPRTVSVGGSNKMERMFSFFENTPADTAKTFQSMGMAMPKETALADSARSAYKAKLSNLSPASLESYKASVKEPWQIKKKKKTQ
mgnify:CR=1 FL=1|jgi:hypothetical protein|tara:strand:- start:8925 stop:9401 length:477 start_codon:yes stop_codon:yes gene_type:complete